jgi:lipopolysaccharide biosynthesis glycosyltransferase
VTAVRPVLVLAIDDSYCEPLLVALYSLSQSNPQSVTDHFDIVLMYEGLSEQTKQRVLACADQLGLPVEFRLAVLPDLPFNTAFGGTRAHYLRLAIPDTLADRNRAVYLDADILVLADVTPLLEAELGDLPIGAVRDSLNPTLATGRALDGWEDLGLSGDQEYFNSGVLVMNLEACRHSLFGEAFQAVADHSDKLRLWDQDALNLAAADRWFRLARRWNTIPFSALRRTPWARYRAEHIVPASQLIKEESEAAIMHYVSPSKPWRGLLPKGYASDLYQKHRAELETLIPAAFPLGDGNG